MPGLLDHSASPLSSAALGPSGVLSSTSWANRSLNIASEHRFCVLRTSTPYEPASRQIEPTACCLQRVLVALSYRRGNSFAPTARPGSAGSGGRMSAGGLGV